MENTNKKVSKMEIVKGAVIIIPLMSDWTLRSVIVAFTVSGCGCSLTGGIMALNKKNKAEKSEEKNIVVM